MLESCDTVGSFSSLIRVFVEVQLQLTAVQLEQRAVYKFAKLQPAVHIGLNIALQSIGPLLKGCSLEKTLLTLSTNPWEDHLNYTCLLWS